MTKRDLQRFKPPEKLQLHKLFCLKKNSVSEVMCTGILIVDDLTFYYFYEKCLNITNTYHNRGATSLPKHAVGSAVLHLLRE